MPNYLFRQFPWDHRPLSRDTRMGVLGESDWGNWSPWLSWNPDGSLLSLLPHTLLKAVFQGALSVKSLNLGCNMCFVWFLGMQPCWLAEGDLPPAWLQHLLCQSSKFVVVLTAVVPWLLAGGGGRVLSGETSGWRHEEGVTLQESWGCTQQVTATIRSAIDEYVYVLESQPYHPRGGLWRSEKDLDRAEVVKRSPAKGMCVAPGGTGWLWCQARGPRLWANSAYSSSRPQNHRMV